VWDYPIRPGSFEWDKANTLEARLNLYNIPSNLLRVMKTEDLVKTCLNYPELRMIMSRNNFFEGYTFLKTNFNGFRELEKRPDAGKILLSIYEDIRHDDVVKIPKSIDKGHFMANILHLEIIIVQDPIISSLSSEELISLKTKAIKSYESILSLEEYFSIFPLEFPALIMCKVLNIEKEINPFLNQSFDKELSAFLKYPHVSNSSVWDRVYEIATK